ncbi:MAG: hypothetical protein WA919_23110 [Coleofasciculaceae cyanobacterium]
MNLIQFLVEQGANAINELPKGIKHTQEAVVETINYQLVVDN